MTSFTCSSRQARRQRVHWMQASRLTAIAACERSAFGWCRDGKARLADLQRLRPAIELGVERVGLLGDVGEQELQHHLLAGHRARVVGRDFHPVLGGAAAGGREHALALDLDHAGAAVAVGAQALLVAEVRNVDAVVLGGLDEGFVRAADDGPAVQLELDGHRRRLRCADPVHRSPRHQATSCGKYFITESTGLGAACPKPQIEASIIACDNSFSSG